MTYATQRDTVGRKPVTIVEMDFDKCGNVFGGGLLSPLNGSCTASNSSGELVTNGGFTASPFSNGWTPMFSTLSLVAGACRVTSSIGGVSYVYQTITTVPGVQYTVTADLVTDGVTGGAGLNVSAFSPNGSDLGQDWDGSATVRTYSVTFTASGTTTYISGTMSSSALAGEYLDWDNFSCPGVDGDLKCYNTRATCRDPNNFTNTSTFTAYFSDTLIPGESYIPCIESTKLAPTVITPGQPFNKRANITIVFNDFPHHDRGVDPYVSDRTYTPENQGTYFGKLLARNPFYQGRALRLKTGYVADPFDTADLQTQNYIIEKITGPDKKGRVTVVAKDILKLADNERAQCPKASTASLASGITAGATTLTLNADDEDSLLEPIELINQDFSDPSLVDFTNAKDGWQLWPSASPEAISISGGEVHFNGTGVYTDFNQYPLHEDLIIGDWYKVVIEITAISGGSIKLNDASIYPTIGSSVGTHELYFQAARAKLHIYQSSYANTASISSVRLWKVSEYIRIGDEIIYAPYSGRGAGSPSLPHEFSSLTRGALNTTAAAHAAGDAVQNCRYWSAVNVRNIVEDLLVNYAGIPHSYIDWANWDSEESTWLSGGNLTRCIAEPTGVKDLLDELSEQLMIYIWWDSKNQLIKFKAIAPPDTPTVTLDEDGNIIGDVEVDVEEEDRKSRVLLYYNPRNPLEASEPKHFDSVYGFIDNAKESADQYNDIRLKQIFGSWITSDAQALTTASRTKNQFENPPKTVRFMVDAKDTGNEIGDTVFLDSRRIQDEDGSNKITQIQLVSVEEVTRQAPGTHYKFTALTTQFSGRYAKIMTAGASDYSSATDSEKNNGAYIITAGQSYFSDGGEAYKIA